jgi:hypothetical protein
MRAGRPSPADAWGGENCYNYPEKIKTINYIKGAYI